MLTTQRSGAGDSPVGEASVRAEWGARQRTKQRFLIKRAAPATCNFLLKGLRKVRGEFSLTVLAYNLKRVLNLVTVPRLLEALA